VGHLPSELVVGTRILFPFRALDNLDE